MKTPADKARENLAYLRELAAQAEAKQAERAARREAEIEKLRVELSEKSNQSREEFLDRQHISALEQRIIYQSSDIDPQQGE